MLMLRYVQGFTIICSIVEVLFNINTTSIAVGVMKLHKPNLIFVHTVSSFICLLSDCSASCGRGTPGQGKESQWKDKIQSNFIWKGEVLLKFILKTLSWIYPLSYMTGTSHHHMVALVGVKPFM